MSTRGHDRSERVPSASERYAAAMKRNAYERTECAQFAHSFDFFLDNYQLTALERVEAGDNVLVAAPTGAGKTVVGEFALHMAATKQSRAFYTTPIKALSNQKFRELKKRFGEEQVGLLTGDVAINADADIVVMTTEVARNMIYAQKDLSDLHSIVLDEVHYLSDRFRGPVWEEVIIHTPDHVQLIALSATVSNAEEFGDWIGQVRGGCSIVVSEERPVPLYQHMMVGRKLYDLYAPDQTGRQRLSGRINPELRSAVAHSAGIRSRSAYDHSRGLAGGRRMRSERPGPRRPSRPETVISLDRAHLLPAIYFIFSRAGCDDAVDHVVNAGIRLTNAQEREEIAQVVDAAIASLEGEDYAVLGLDRWALSLEAGIAAHHAGLLPVMKETVETLFGQGLIKVVFATETLALGINMPARTVVLESLEKWNGVARVSLSPGEYTQLTGRAGRRGIDIEGHAVVHYTRTIGPDEVSALASKRTYPLISAFRPTYNMVANLAASGTLAQARQVMEESFAQFQADRTVVGHARDLRSAQRRMDELSGAFACSQGDAQEYFALRDDLTRLQKNAAKRRVTVNHSEVESALLQLRVGDVIELPGRRRGVDAVITRSARRGQRSASVQVVSADGTIQQVNAATLTDGVNIVGSMRLRKDHVRKVGRFKDAIAKDVRMMRRRGKLSTIRKRKPRLSKDVQAHIGRLEAHIRSHPVHTCPDRELHAAKASQWQRARREYVRLSGIIDEQTSSVAKMFDRIVTVLENLGILHDQEITSAGETLRGIYGEKDLLVALVVKAGIWDNLEPAELAAAVSACVFEPRKDHAPDMDIPGGAKGPVGVALHETAQILTTVNRAENAARAQNTPPLELGLVSAMYWWVKGDSLATAVRSSDLEAGDWVRWCRQVIDLLGQIRSVASPELARTAKLSIELIRRSVVALAEDA